MTPLYEEIIEKLRKGDVQPELLRRQYSELVIVVYYNRVYDITRLVHPGGAYPFKLVNFTEISKYLHGTAGLENNHSIAWKHSKDAFRMLEHYFLAELHTDSYQELTEL
jgi:hypothetical protein